MFWQLTNGLFSLNFAVSFGVLVKWSKLDTKLFSYIGFKIPNPTRMKSQIILLHRTSDNFQELFFFFPPLYYSVVSRCFNSISATSWFMSVVFYFLPTQKRKKKGSLIFQGLSSYTLNIIPFHESLLHCVQPILQKAENRCICMWFSRYFQLLHF